MTHRRYPQDAFVFDLDGTLVDSVYQHVMAWREALGAEGIELSTWRIHRKVGMSGGLMSRMLLLETGVELDPARADRLRRLHADAYRARLTDVRPPPGAQRLLSSLTEAGIPWAIATSGGRDVATSTLRKLELDLTRVPVVTRDEVEHAKPALRRGGGATAASVIVASASAARRSRGCRCPIDSRRGPQDHLCPAHVAPVEVLVRLGRLAQGQLVRDDERRLGLPHVNEVA